MTGASVTVRVSFGGKAPAASTPKQEPTVASPSVRRARRRSSPIANDRLAHQLALAHAIERGIASGGLANAAEFAVRVGVSRPRITQVMALLHLAPTIQEGILCGQLAATERDLRVITRIPSWRAQAIALRSSHRPRRDTPSFRIDCIRAESPN